MSPQHEQGTVRISSSDGFTIAVHHLAGDVDDPPLILAHATGLHGRCWIPVARRLTGWRVLALDFRGHGDSDARTDHSYAWEGFADDVLAVVDALCSRPPFAAGHSKGGAALLLAEGRRPGTFSGLWCYEPVVLPPRLRGTGDAAGGDFLAEAAERRRETFPSRDAALENFASKPPFDVVDREALEAYVDFGFEVQSDGSLRLKCPPRVEAAVYRQGPLHDAWRRLGSIACHVTVARGGLAIGPAAFAEELAQSCRSATVEVYEDLGHFGPLQDPARTAGAIGRAAERSSGAGADPRG